MLLARVRTAGMYESAANFYRATVQIVMAGAPTVAFRPMYQIKHDTGIAGYVIGTSFEMPANLTTVEITSNIVPTGSPVGTATFDIAQITPIPQPGR